MQVLIEDNEREAYSSLYSDRPADIGRLTAGAVLALTVGRLKRILSPYDSKLFQPQALSGWTMRAAVGGGFILPVAGNWPITFTDSGDVSHSSDWILPPDPTSDDIQNALNGLDAVTTAGGVSVQGRKGFFQITFNSVGARNLITANPARLSPLSVIDVSRAVTGDGSTQEVQVLQIAQNVGAMVSLTADTISTTIAQTDIVVGDGTHNAKIRLTFPENIYGGTWSLTKSTTTAENLSPDWNEAQLEDALETAFGVGKITVSQVDELNFDLTFIGTFGLQAITITVSGSALLITPTFSGELDLTGVGVEELFAENDSVIAKFEIEGAASGGAMQKMFQADVPLNRPVISAATVTPSAVQSIEEYSGTETDGAITGTLSAVLSPAKRFLQWFKLYTVAAGSASTYTANIGLSGTKAISGARYTVELDMAATGNPTVNIRDGSATGTIIDTIPGDSSNAQYYVGEYRWDGSHFKKLRGQFQ